MSIAHLKKQAKNLVRLLPAHISANPTGGSLAACQELIARASGYPSFHAATAAETNERSNSIPLSQRIFDDLQDVHRQAASNEGDVWPLRTEGLIGAVLDLQLFLEARGQSLSDESLYEFHALEAACQKWQSFAVKGANTLEHYLSSLPWYESPAKRGSKPVEETTVIHHGFVAMAIKSLRKEQPTVPQKPLDVVNHGDGHFTVSVNPAIAEDHLRSSLERLCLTAKKLDFNGEHPALTKICPGLARQGVAINTYRTPIALASLHVPFHMVDKLFPRDGLVLLSSLKGHGKSSFRASIANEILYRHDSQFVIAFEDPIEYYYEVIPPHSGSVYVTDQSFKTSAIQATKRDPDAIFAGEAKDLEFIERIIQVAQSGYAMYAEVNANSAVDAVMKVLGKINPHHFDQAGKGFIVSLSLVTWQTMAIGRNGKLIPIYEFLSFSRKMKDTFLDFDLTELSAIKQILNAEICRQGNDLSSNAKLALQEGRIEKNAFDRVMAMRQN